MVLKLEDLNRRARAVAVTSELNLPAPWWNPPCTEGASVDRAGFTQWTVVAAARSLSASDAKV